MFERFTTRARNTVVLAQEEARQLNHNWIGTEHLLLGLLRDPESVAARALQRMKIGLDDVRDDVREIIGAGAGTEAPSGHIPFTPRAKKVLELSLREALQFGHNYIGTEHILLGVVREGEGVAAQVLVRRGANLELVRAVVTQELKRPGPPAPEPRPSRTPATDEALAAARELAAGGPVGTHHLLEVLVRSTDSAAGKVLASLAVDPDALAAAIDALDLDTTTDRTPGEEAQRQMRIVVQDDELHIVLRDAETIERVRALTEHLGNELRGDDAVPGLGGMWHAVTSELGEIERRVMPAPPQPARFETVREAIRARLHRRRER